MHVDSPYWTERDAWAELFRRFPLASAEELRALIAEAVAREYGPVVLEIERLRIPYSICAQIRTSQGRLYFKTVGDNRNDAVPDLLDLVAYLRERGVPLPMVLPTTAGTRQIAFLGRSACVISEVPGQPISGTSVRQVAAYAWCMANFHRVGADYAARGRIAAGGEAAKLSIVERVRADLPRMRANFLTRHRATFDVAALRTLGESLRYFDHRSRQLAPDALTRTHIHGDFRMCHVLQEQDEITGVIDFEEACYGERMVDVCFGLVSGPSHDDGKAMSVERQGLFLREYDRHLPFATEEIEALPWLLVWANLVQPRDLCRYRARGLASRSGAISSTVAEVAGLMSGAIPTLC